MRSIRVMCSCPRGPIEPISHPIRAWVPLGKAQRIEELTYEPVLYLRVLGHRIDAQSHDKSCEELDCACMVAIAGRTST